MRYLALILTTTACGLAPNAIGTGRRIGDGSAPWTDEGAIQLCLGNDRIGPGGSEVGGFCADINIPDEKTCGADADCASRERCMCGRCTVTYCSAASECGGSGSRPGKDFTCNFTEHRCLRSCASSDECPGRNEVCLGGTCRGRCGTDADCEYGESCSAQNGRCVVAACSSDTTCKVGDFCKTQRLPRTTGQPSAIAGEDGLVVLYFEMADLSGLETDVYRARSSDGKRFQLDPADPVVTGGLAPSVISDATGYRMYYETPAGIVVATSTDGVDWGAPVDVVDGDYHAPAAAALPTGDVVYVQLGQRAGIGLVDLTGNSVEQVLSPADVSDPVYWKNVTQVGAPSVLVDTSPLGEPILKLWFDAFGQESDDSIQFGQDVPIPPNDSIGFASTLARAPSSFVDYPENPVFDRVVGFLDHRGELAPAVVERSPERYLLYYRATSADGMTEEGIGVATNP